MQSLSQDSSPQVRRFPAKKPAITKPILETLTRDPYESVRHQSLETLQASGASPSGGGTWSNILLKWVGILLIGTVVVLGTAIKWGALDKWGEGSPWSAPFKFIKAIL